MPDRAAAARQSGFGLALILLSALGTITGAAFFLLVDWRAGLAMYAAVTLLLVVFLRSEMRRRATSRRNAVARQKPADLVVTRTNSL